MNVLLLPMFSPIVGKLMFAHIRNVIEWAKIRYTVYSIYYSIDDSSQILTFKLV